MYSSKSHIYILERPHVWKVLLHLRRQLCHFNDLLTLDYPHLGFGKVWATSLKAKLAHLQAALIKPYPPRSEAQRRRLFICKSPVYLLTCLSSNVHLQQKPRLPQDHRRIPYRYIDIHLLVACSLFLSTPQSAPSQMSPVCKEPSPTDV